ncbi:extensin-like [Portunus trituberculatus]|uniref:extensin-like n=1 Tax=Portunus trituberculatus TaxID=210409 RepID=UPI001E1CD027|nr:extensin-like [Portunus trituberculatus]
MHGDRTPRPTRPDPPCSGRRARAGHHGGGDEVVSKVVSTMKGSGGCVTLTSSAFLPCLPPITPCLPHSSTLYSLSPQPLPLLGAPPHSPSLQTHDTHPMPPALRPLPTSTPTHIPPPPTSPLPTSIHPPPKLGSLAHLLIVQGPPIPPYLTQPHLTSTHPLPLTPVCCPSPPGRPGHCSSQWSTGSFLAPAAHLACLVPSVLPREPSLGPHTGHL